MNDRLLYFKERASPESFQQAMQALLAAGYESSSAPARNHDGCAVRLKKEEEIWLEWFDTDSLTVSAVAAPSDRLRSEVLSILGGTPMEEIKII